MSTRCNIKITVEGLTGYLYRHGDGYLSVTGQDVAKCGRKLENGEIAKTWQAITNYFTSQADPYPSGHSLYEHTDGLHDDIEHLYQIDVTPRGTVIIGHKERPADWWTTGFDYVERMEAEIVRYKLSTFERKVALEMRRDGQGPLVVRRVIGRFGQRFAR